MADDLSEARRQLVARAASAHEPMERSIDAAQATRAKAAFIATPFAGARAAAAAADRAIAGGREAGALAGLAVSIKDVFDIAGETTAVQVVAPPLTPRLDDDEAFFATNNLLLRNPSSVNFLDGCALRLPRERAGELPVGLMVRHGAGHDDTVLAAGRAIEAAFADDSDRLRH